MKRSVITKLCLSLALGTPIVASAVDSTSGLGELQRRLDQIYFMSPNGTCGATTAIASPILENDCNQCCGNWFLQFSILYWHAKVNGTDFGYSIANNNGQFAISGRLKEMEFDWDWGLKAGLGYNLPHDGWDVFLGYTWFDSRGSKRGSPSRNNALVPLQGNSAITRPNGFFAYSTRARSLFRVILNSLDLEMGRYYYVSEHLAVRPQLGGKASWIKLAQAVRYGGGALGTEWVSTGLASHLVQIKGKNEFFGVGPRIGAFSNWHICRGFSIFGNVATSLLYGNIDITHKNDYSLLKCLNNIKLSEKCHIFIPNIEFQIGLQFDQYFNEDKNHIRLQINYDTQYFWRINQMIRANQILSLDKPVSNYSHFSEDLGIYGITATLRIDF